MIRNLLVKCWLVIIFIASSCTSQTQNSIQIEPLGQVVIPYNQQFEGTPIGGLSGLTYDPASELFYVVSDDRSELADARFYSFRLQLTGDRKLGDEGIRWHDVHFLQTPQGGHYQLGTVDPEGIAVGPDSLMYVTSEGGREGGVPPFINAYRKDGAFERDLMLPPAYWASQGSERTTRGVRNNLAFESLTITPDGKTLYSATENALKQDGPVADTLSASPSRIIVYNRTSGDVLHEYRYNVEKVFLEPGPHGPFAVNGLSELLALNNDGRLLALDRNYVQGQGNHIRLYEVQTAGATDIKEVDNMNQYDGTITPVSKTLIADLSDYDIIIDNYEGMTLGPALPGGGRLLLLVSDNNFSDEQQTVFTAFRIKYD